MKLSIIVTSYKNPQLLKVCLNSVVEHAKGLDYELISVDSETQEETQSMMREEFPLVRFFPFVQNVGFQGLLKKGIQESFGDYILLLNGDIIVTEESIQKMLNFMDENPKVGMLGPKLLNFDGTLQYSCFRFYRPMTIVYRRTFLGKFSFAKKHLDWFLMKDADREKFLKVDWLMGSAMLITRKALQKVGYMDENFFMYMEDVDWCRRFWENGFEVVYYPAAKMHHYHGKASAKGGALRSLMFNKLTWIHITSAIKYFKKYWGKPLPQHEQ